MRTTKPIHSFILGLSIMAVSAITPPCFAIIKLNVDPAERQAALDAKQSDINAGGAVDFGQHEPVAPIAEAITVQISQLARDLENDPVRMYNYVHDHIRHVLYFGSKKGAELTLLEKSGNDFDQCALLMALLRAAGYSNAVYQFGWMEMPYDTADHKDLHHWLQLSLSNTNWSTTSNYLDSLIRVYRGYPRTAAIWDTNTFGFQRMWIKLTIGGTNFFLDPAFKVSEAISGINLQSATSFSSNSLMTAAGGTDTGTYVTNLSESAVRGTLTGYTTNLLNYIQSNTPNVSVAQILGGYQTTPLTNTTLSQSVPFTTYEWGGQMPVLTFTNQPTNLMSTLTIALEGTNFFCYMPQLQGQRLTLTYYNDDGQLWLEDTLAADAPSSFTGNVTISVNHPVGSWNTNSNTFVDTTAYDQSTTNNYILSNLYAPGYTIYNLIYSFEPDWGWLKQRQDSLDYLRLAGYGDGSFDVLAETMNIMGLQYSLQTWNAETLMAPQTAMSPQNYHSIGRLGEEGANGYYFDIFMTRSGDIPTSGIDSANTNRLNNFERLSDYFGSALEHGVIEQLQNSNYLAASTVKMLEIAVTNGQAVYLATSNNWVTVSNKLSNYSTAEKNNFKSLVTAGDTVLLPQNGVNYVDPVGTWSGNGYVVVGPVNPGFIINGIYGGQVSYQYATVNPAYVAFSGQMQPRRKPFIRNVTAADPVDMANGTFQTESTDLSLGQQEPRGISFGRYYNSRNRYINSAGLAPGWVHNYFVNAQAACAPEAGFGYTTPAQAAPMIAATCAALGIYNDSQPTPKNWTVTALIAKWASDQLNQKGVSVNMGKDTLQFVQQPNGAFTPPANSTWTLTKPAGYQVQERHGNTFNFDLAGRLTNVVDQYNQALRLSYNSSGLVTNVTDWKSRSLTFTYSGSPAQLTQVSDSTGRSVKYAYHTNGSDNAADLISFSDAEGKTNTFTYNGIHAIKTVLNGLNQLVTSNLYDSVGFARVNSQYSQGDTSKTWQIYWSGWQTVEQDPAGGKRRFLYDDSSRLIGFQDAVGNLTQTFYDGQDHVVTTISPLNETNQFIYDGNQNVTSAIDPLGYSNQFIFDSQNNLTTSVDRRGSTNRFGYNSKFQLTGSTNAAGDWITLAYSSTDGTLTTRTDPGMVTTYGYDTYGQISSATYDSLGSEGFLNNSLGDVLSHTNGRGFVTSFQYNSRREVTNSVAPTNLTAKATIDAAQNLVALTDPRGFITSNNWSATRRLLSTLRPSTPQGVPSVTNVYDNREWISQTVAPLQRTTTMTNDAAGRLVSSTDPIQRTTKFVYDADNRISFTTNAALEVTRRDWSARNELLKLTDPATNVVSRVFDSQGNQTTLTNRNGKRWQFQFDAANRLTNSVTPLNRETRLTFDSRGLVSTIREPSTQTTTNFYDARARLTNRTDQVAVRTYGYDANNNLTNVVESGRSNSWTFDAYDRVSSYRDADGNLIQYRWDANGNLTNLVYPGNRTVTYAFDSLNRLTNVTDWSGRQTTLIYDLANRLTNIVRPNNTQRTIKYDAADQATNIIEQTITGGGVSFHKLNWDSAGRVQWEFAAPLPHSNSLASRTMTFDDDNRLATFNGSTITNDLDGNMTWGPATNSTLVAYSYDARNRLLSAAGLNYGYDPLGSKTTLTNGTNVARFTINPNAPLSQVLIRTRGTTTNYYIYGPGLLYEITETASTTNTLTYHYDLRGSTIALTDQAGNVKERFEYSGYGTLNYRSSTNDTPFLYNGRYGVQTDPNGLLYMRARCYNPYICRFINADPAGFSGGLNFYAYADGNPISMMDPFGLGAIGESTSPSWFSTGWTYTLEARILGVIPAPLGYRPYVWGDTAGKQVYAQFYNLTSLAANTFFGLLDSANMAVDRFGNSIGMPGLSSDLAMMGIPGAPLASMSALGTLAGAEETLTIYHGTTTSAARNILSSGFRGGLDNAVFFAEDFSTAAAFGELRVAETGARSGQVLRFTLPQSLAEDLGLTTQSTLGEFRGAAPIDILGGSGFERILSGDNIGAFNQAVRNGQISVKPIGIRH